jgi:uncharacterized protein (DUF1800 family)
MKRWAYRVRVIGAGIAVLAASGLATGAEPAPIGPDLVVHVLNRVAFGPRPGDIDRVTRMGVNRYLDEQLHPETIPMPADLSARLAALETQNLSARDLIEEFRRGQQAAKKDPENGNNERRALYLKLAQQSGEARLLRAVDSPRQLQEVMVDFWYSHFNVFQGKGLDRVLVANYERDAIRPYAMGRFRDLLGATAHHPAMLFYLDNWESSAPGYQGRGLAGAGKASGLNENYARELMELHTLGVDGGYTQKDVTELARILTGWTFAPRFSSGSSVFVFDSQRHDWGDKEWLGRHVGPRGQAEGEFALDVLAQSPATAHHIAYELAQYFVSDAPPAALVDRLAQRFTRSDGDIRAVLDTLFHSPEFLDPANEGAKFKTPYQYVISATRASGLPVTNVRPLLVAMNQLGEPLYGCQTPDGYKNTEDAWLNPDAISRRINFATILASGRLPLSRQVDESTGRPFAQRIAGRPADPDNTGIVAANATGSNRAAAGSTSGTFNGAANGQAAGGDTGAADNTVLSAAEADPVDLDRLLDTLGDAVSGKTLKALTTTQPQLRAALVLGSPDFMRR